MFELIGLTAVYLAWGFTVTCANTLPKQDANEEDPNQERPLTENRLWELKNSLLWPRQIVQWLSSGDLEHLALLGGYIWCAVITCWLILWLYDKIARIQWQYAAAAYLLSVEVTMGIVTMCLLLLPGNRTSKNGTLSTRQIWIRGAFWFTTLPRLFRSGRFDFVLQYIVVVWLILTALWKSGAVYDVFVKSIKAVWYMF